MTDPLAHPRTESLEVRRYCDDLLVALRMREVPGPRIGEVLTEVRAHLADSGEDPAEAFGTPEEYAAELVGETPSRTRADRVREGLLGACFALGGCWLAEGATGLATGDTAGLGPSALILAALAAVGGAWALEQLVSSSRRRMVQGVLAVAAALTAATALGVLVDDRFVVTTPAVVPLALGIALLAAGAWSLRDAADPVVDPFQGPEEAAAERRRSGLLLSAVLWGSLLALAALVAGAAVLVERLG